VLLVGLTPKKLKILIPSIFHKLKALLFVVYRHNFLVRPTRRLTQQLDVLNEYCNTWKLQVRVDKGSKVAICLFLNVEYLKASYIYLHISPLF
jgi:hypothetical protein